MSKSRGKIEPKSVTVDDAKAILDADKQRRSKELFEIIQREAERLQCDVTASVQIIPR